MDDALAPIYWAKSQEMPGGTWVCEAIDYYTALAWCHLDSQWDIRHGFQ